MYLPCYEHHAIEQVADSSRQDQFPAIVTANMAPATKSNFKSYEAQARLLRAIIAAHPEVKWNHKGRYIVLSVTIFLPIFSLSYSGERHQPVLSLPSVGDISDFGVEICKYYGSDMTEYALQHRFRALKRHADVVFQAANIHNIDCRAIPADLPKEQDRAR